MPGPDSTARSGSRTSFETDDVGLGAQEDRRPADRPAVNSIDGAKILADRIGDRDTAIRPEVSHGARALFHWCGVNPVESSHADTAVERPRRRLRLRIRSRES